MLHYLSASKHIRDLSFFDPGQPGQKADLDRHLDQSKLLILLPYSSLCFTDPSDPSKIRDISNI